MGGNSSFNIRINGDGTTGGGRGSGYVDLGSLNIADWGNNDAYQRALADYQWQGASNAVQEGGRTESSPNLVGEDSQGQDVYDNRLSSWSNDVDNTENEKQTWSVGQAPTIEPIKPTAKAYKNTGLPGAGYDYEGAAEEEKRNKERALQDVESNELQEQPVKKPKLPRSSTGRTTPPAGTESLARFLGQSPDNRNHTLKAERKRKKEEEERKKAEGGFLDSEMLDESYLPAYKPEQAPAEGNVMGTFRQGSENGTDEYVGERPMFDEDLADYEMLNEGDFDYIADSEDPIRAAEELMENVPTPKVNGLDWDPFFREVGPDTYRKYLKNPDRLGELFSEYQYKRSEADKVAENLDATISNIMDNIENPNRSRPESIIEEERRRGVERQFIKDYHSGLLNVESSYLQEVVDVDMKGNEVKYGIWKADEETEGMLSQFASYFGLDPMKDLKTINQTMRLVLGYGADRDIQVFAKNPASVGQDVTTDVYKNMIRTALVLVDSSINEVGHPFAFTQANIDHPVAGHYRFPVGVIDAELAAKLSAREGSVMYGRSVEEIQRAAKESWLTTKDILDNWAVNTKEGPAIRKSVLDMARAMCHYTGQATTDFGMEEMGQDKVLDLKYADRKFEDAIRNADPEHADELIQRIKEQRMQEQLARRNKAQEFANVMTARATGAKEGTGKASSEIASAALSAYRTLHIAGDIALATSSVAEQVKGLTEVSLMNKAFLLNDTDQQLPKDWFSGMGANNQVQFLDAVNAIEMLIQAAGGRRDLLVDFLAKNDVISTQAVEAYMVDLMPEPQLPRLAEWTQKFKKVSDAIMVGDFATAKPFAKQLIGSFMVEQSRMEDGITGAQLAEALKENPQGALSVIAESDAFWNSYHRTVNTTYKRISPASVAMQSFLQRSGVWDLGTALLFNTGYLNYGLKVLEAWLPGSNTMQYLAVVAGTKAGVMDKTWLEASIGGTDALAGKYMAGLKTCLSYDLARFGSTLAQAMAHVAFIGFFGGVQPPDDDPTESEEIRQAKKHDYRFWKVKNPFTGEWESIMVAWYMDDLTQWSIPAAIAISAWKNSDIDFNEKDMAQMAINGGLDMLAGNRVLTGFQVLADTGKDIFDGGDFDWSRFAINPGRELEARALKVLSDPMVVSQFHDLLHEGDFMRDPFLKTDGTSRTAREAQLNQWALNNDLGGWLLNRFGFGGDKWGWEGSALRTEFDRDDKLSADSNSFAEVCKRYGIEQSDPEAAKRYFEDFKGMVAQKGSVAALAKDGYRMHKQDAYIINDYLNGEIDKLYDQMNYLAQHDISAYWDAKPGIYAKIEELKSWKNDIYYEGILFDKNQYNVLYNTQIKIPGVKDENGKEVYVDFGDNPSEGLLFNTVSHGTMKDTDENGYREHQFRNVYDSKSDTEGNYGDFRTDKYTDDGRTADGRKWIPVDTEKKTLTDEEIQELAAAGYGSTQYNSLNYADRLAVDAAIQDAKKDQVATTANNSSSKSGGTSWSRSYSYSKSYSGGGGSTEYNPKIYAIHAGNLSPNKPATLYSKSPYSTKVTYLSPQVTTKGSHGAYRRNEM